MCYGRGTLGVVVGGMGVVVGGMGLVLSAWHFGPRAMGMASQRSLPH